FPDELDRRGPDLLLGRGRLEVVERLDGTAHGQILLSKSRCEETSQDLEHPERSHGTGATIKPSRREWEPDLESPTLPIDEQASRSLPRQARLLENAGTRRRQARSQKERQRVCHPEARGAPAALRLSPGAGRRAEKLG